MSSNSVCNHTRDKQSGLPLRGRPILLSLVWLQTELDSTQSYYHYLILISSLSFWLVWSYSILLLEFESGLLSFPAFSRGSKYRTYQTSINNHLQIIGHRAFNPPFTFIKELLDEVEHDIMNYQNRGLCYLPKPKAEADNIDTRFW